MAFVLKDRVKDTTTSTGTGTITLANGPPAGFRAFSSVGNGNTCLYMISDASNWEVGVGTYSATGPALARTTVTANSLGTTAKINFAAGTKDVALVASADFLAGLLVASGYLPKSNGTNGYTASVAYDNGSDSLLIGTTSTAGLYSGASVNPGVQMDAAGAVAVQRNNNPCIFLGKAVGFADGQLINFYYNGAAIGNITTNGTTGVTYNVTSDATLKNDHGLLSAEDARRVMTLIRIHNYSWKADGSEAIGPFAQELHEVFPAAVTVGGWWQNYESGERRDEEFEGATYVPWQVDNSKLMPIVVRAIQDHETRLADIANRVAALEAAATS